MQNLLQIESFKLIIGVSGFLVVLLALFLLNRQLYKYLRKKAQQTESTLDDFMLDLFKIPGLVLMYWIAAQIFTSFVSVDDHFAYYLHHVNSLLIIVIITWISMQGVRLAVYHIRKKLDVSVPDNLNARTNLTQINIFKNIINTAIIVIAFAAALMTFDQVKNIGISLLTSAGVLGIIVGLAAQKSIGMILSGIQIAITQPVRIDDVVVVENEWGRIEEITLTYVVVKIWDERRLILPVNYFLEKPFQNWTRTSANILGSVFIYVDYSFPVESLRGKLTELIKNNSKWDGRVANIQITDQNDRHKELRVLVSSSNSSDNWDLKVFLREQLTDYIQHEYPETFAKIRIEEH
jgi:small-conductance mechanosensitive channel